MTKQNLKTEPSNSTKPVLCADFTGLFDDNNKPIKVGDKLKSEWNYIVVVCKDIDGDLYGKLICDENHSCKDIPYSLNNGSGFTICT